MTSKLPWLSTALIAALCAGSLFATHHAVSDQGRLLDHQARAIAQLETRLVELAQANEPHTANTELAAVLDRLQRLESAPRQPVARPSGSRTQPEVAQPSEAGAAREDAPPTPAADEAHELDLLLESVLGPGMDLGGTDEERDRFWELIKNTDVVDRRMQELESLVALHPEDSELRMALADTYVAKLFAVPSGPEQGRWGGRAEEQWRSVLELDPEHWEAQFTLANNYAYYPDVMGMTGTAIEGLERAREIQERRAPTEEHVQTYLSLARLYQRGHRLEEALDTLRAGQRQHPRSERLRAALAELESQLESQ